MLFFEDMNPGKSVTSPPLTVDRDEMVEFARRWDPMPFHISDEAGMATFGGMTAPGTFVLAVKQRLIHQLPDPHAVIASLGYDEVRFFEPVRPGDTVRLKYEWVTRRESKSKPDRGVVTARLSLINQTGKTVMSHLDIILVRRRSPTVGLHGEVG